MTGAAEPLHPAPIVLEVTSAASPDRAWRAITDPDEVAGWFADVTPVDGVGSPYRIDFGDGSVIDGRIRSLEPGRRLAYTWTWADEIDAPTTLVTWEIEDDAAGSLVRLIHDGWAQAGVDDATRDDHATAWASYLAALQDWLEDGE